MVIQDLRLGGGGRPHIVRGGGGGLAGYGYWVYFFYLDRRVNEGERGAA